jgi:hypothetical protein
MREIFGNVIEKMPAKLIDLSAPEFLPCTILNKHTEDTKFHLNQRNCFLSSAAKNLRYFTKNKPSFCQNKKVVGVGLVVIF